MTHPVTGEFYIGRRSSNLDPELDIGYRGSSIRWYKNLDQYIIKNVLIKDIIKRDIECIEKLISLENDEIVKNIDNPLCKNAHIPSKGFFSKPGYKLSEETKSKMSLNNTGKKHNPETIEKIRNSILSNPNRFRKATEEFKLRMSEIHKGKKLSDEHIEILKKPKTDEHKEKLRGPRPEYRRPKEKIKCPHCDKWGAPNVMYRFHFDRCGLKEELKKIDCPHCEKSGSISNMKRWHFDNCKFLSDKNRD